MYLLGAFVVGAAFATVIMLITHPVPSENRDIVNVSLGTILGMAVMVVGYFYGSSKSSADKTELMKPADNTPAP